MPDPLPSSPVDPRPFVAPCRELPVTAPFGWVKAGWRDLKHAPLQSLVYGAFFVAFSYLISFVAYSWGSLPFFLGLLSGFIFLGPVLAVGLYAMSRQLQLGRRPSLGHALREGIRHLGNELVFTLMLLVVFLVWARAASMVHVFFPLEAHPELRQLVGFLAIGSAAGSIFALIIFSASAFSLPMIMDRSVDMVTAVVTSIHAVLRNKLAMVVWIGIIVSSVCVGFLTAFLGLGVLIPLLGYATWHAYEETIDATDWPRH